MLLAPLMVLCKLSSNREEVMVADLRWKDEIGIRHDISGTTSSSRKFSLLDLIAHILFMYTNAQFHHIQYPDCHLCSTHNWRSLNFWLLFYFFLANHVCCSCSGGIM